MGKIRDLTGQKFGRLTVIERAEDHIQPNGKKRTMWLCQCDCGNKTVVRGDQLTRGNIQSCGCIKTEKIEDLTGQRFGRWTVIGKVKDGKYNHTYWLCECDCGNLKEVYHYNLVKDKTFSCRCIRKEFSKNINKKHGMTGTHIHKTWKGIKSRCNDKNNKLYGGRGIVVCDECLDEENGFINFYNWSIQNGYKDNLTIDRINVNGNYEPSNCRWATKLEQSNNKRNNHYITYKGKTQTLKQWCEELNLSYSMVGQRLNKRGWSIEEAFNKESYPNYNNIYYNNKEQSLAKWCNELNLPYSAIYSRLTRLNWTPEQAFETPVGDERND